MIVASSSASAAISESKLATELAGSAVLNKITPTQRRAIKSLAFNLSYIKFDRGFQRDRTGQFVALSCRNVSSAAFTFYETRSESPTAKEGGGCIEIESNETASQQLKTPPPI